jgi:hypothetical protein
MDPRFKKCKILDRRKEEWNLDIIKEHTDRLFKNIELLEGWEFIKSEWSPTIKSTNKQELKRSIIRTLKIDIKNPAEKEQQFSIQFPELILDQFFYIGGFLKIPVFQLFDDPIIYRKTNSGYMLKYRSNTINLNIDFTKNDDINLRLFGKVIPICKVIALLHEKDEFITFFDKNLTNQGKTDPLLLKLKDECLREWDENPTEEMLINNVGTYFMNNPNEKYKKGEAIKFSFKAAYEIDFFTKKFMKTNCILYEILYAIKEGVRSDSDLERKRLRFSEYILSPLIYKIYEMLITLYKNPKSKFKIAQNVITDKCNRSEIVHFNFPLNPVGEVANLLQCTLTGPGGFKKDNVPSHLRNLDESHQGRICPADTPDREGCGVVLNLVPTLKIDEKGKFLEPDKELVTSYPISLTPFLQNDDQTRLQMASNQSKQTISTKEAEPAWIKTAVESAYLDRTTFLNKAKENGTVIYKDETFIVIQYESKKCESFKLGYRSMYLNTMDHLKTDLNVGDHIEKEQIITCSDFIKNEEICLGQNLLTAVMIYKGYNYEDGIIISESVTNKMTSPHYVDLTFDIEPGQVLLSLDPEVYRPLPKIGDILKKGDVYAKIKLLDWEDGFENIHSEPIEKLAPSDCKITNIEIYPNSWNHKINDFDHYIKNMMNNQNMKYNILVDSLAHKMSPKERKDFIKINGLEKLDCKNQIEKYTIKGKQIGGIKLKITAVYEEKIGIGDKVANRHGNKGVISRIVPEDKMPRLKDGRRAEIIINPLGIISRMNVGQLFELHMNEALRCLRNKMKVLQKREAKKLLKDFLNIIIDDKHKWARETVLTEYRDNLKEYGKDAATKMINLIIPKFGAPNPSKLFEAMNLVDANTRFELYDPETDETIKNEIVCGYMYFLKLVHRSNDKLSSRSIGPYSKRTQQPLGGKKRQGGHRLGEMEVWALISHGADTFLKDILTTHSDSTGKKSKILAQILQNPELANEDNELDDVPQSIKVLNAYFSQLGITMEE